MFGKLLGYEVNNKEIKIQYEKIEATITVINDEVINFFVPLHRKERNSKAVENLNLRNSNFSVEKNENTLNIATEKLKIVINDDFKIDIYDKNEKVLCRDYRSIRHPLKEEEMVLNLQQKKDMF